MSERASFVSLAQVRKKAGWGVFLGLALAQVVWAAGAGAAPSQTVILQPTAASRLRIDFN